MSTRRLVADIPTEIYDQFRLSCVKNHSSMKDELFKLMCASLDGSPIEKSEEGEVVVLSDAQIKDFWDSEKEDFLSVVEGKLEAKLLPIREKLDNLKPVDVNLNSVFERLDVQRNVMNKNNGIYDQNFKALEKKLDGRFVIVGKFIKNIQENIGKICEYEGWKFTYTEDDTKDFAVLLGSGL